MRNKKPRSEENLPNDHLRVIQHCPSCKEIYDVGRITVLDRCDDQIYLHVVCKKCSVGLVALVMISQMGAGMVAVSTDLTGDDAKHFYEKDPIGEDEVLDFHRLLSKSRYFEKTISKGFKPIS